VQLAKRLEPGLVLIDPPVADREELFAAVADAIASHSPEVRPDDVVRALLNREAILSTGVGHGIAVPHAQLPALETLLIGASTHPRGLRYASLDGEPVRLVFCILGGPTTAADHLACLARVARLARHAESLTSLLGAETPEEFLQRLEELERGV